jgi:hypothetical protein
LNRTRLLRILAIALVALGLATPFAPSVLPDSSAKKEMNDETILLDGPIPDPPPDPTT